MHDFCSVFLQWYNPPMRKTTPKGIILLLLTAVIWGSSFVAQSIGMESIDAFTFTALRTTLGAVVLIPVILIFNRKFDLRPSTLIAGLVLGVVFSIAQNLQQFAFYYSTSGKIAFITAFYMFFVPLFSVFLKKKIRLIVWLAIALGLVGLFLICINPEDLTAINPGDALAFGCAVFYAVQIMVIDHYTGKDINGVQLSFMQFVVAAVISWLMCLESVFAVITAAIVLQEMMSFRELAGCVTMFAAIVIAQLPSRTSPEAR